MPMFCYSSIPQLLVSPRQRQLGAPGDGCLCQRPHRRMRQRCAARSGDLFGPQGVKQK